MLDAKALDMVVRHLEPAMFFSQDNTAIWKAIQAIHASGEKVDIVTVSHQTGSSVRARYLAQLIDATPAVAHIASHARIIVDCWRRRSVVATIQQHLPALYQPPEGQAPGDTEELFAALLSDVSRQARRGQRRTCCKLGKAAMAALETEGGLSWGIPELDDAMGLLTAPWVYVIMGMPGNGKTALASWVALSVAKAGWGVVYFACDNDRALIAPRMCCALEQIPYKFFSGAEQANEMALSSYMRATDTLEALPLYMEDRKGPSCATIESVAYQVADDLDKEYGAWWQTLEEGPQRPLGHYGKLGVVIVDQLQTAGLLRGPRRQSWTRAEQLQLTVREYIAVAKRLGVPLVVMSQLSKDGEGPYPFGSRAVAQEVDNIGAISTTSDRMDLDLESPRCKRRAGVRRNACWNWYPERQGF
jgi:replicative DNA helicase